MCFVWSWAKTACCVICLLIFSAIGLGIYAAVTGKTPTIEYQSSEIYCNSNVTARQCVERFGYGSSSLPLQSIFRIDNPNLVGATISTTFELNDANTGASTYNNHLCNGEILESWIAPNTYTLVKSSCLITNATDSTYLVKSLLTGPLQPYRFKVSGWAFVKLPFVSPKFPFSLYYTVTGPL